MTLTNGEIDWILHDNVNAYLYDLEGQKAILANEFEVTTVSVPRVELLNAVIDNAREFDPYDRFFTPLMRTYYDLLYAPQDHVIVPDDGDVARDILGAKSVLPLKRDAILVPLMEEVARHDSAFVYDRRGKALLLLEGGAISSLPLGQEHAFAFSLLKEGGYDMHDLMENIADVDLDGDEAERLLSSIDPVPFTREAMAREWAKTRGGDMLISEASKVRTPAGNLVIRRFPENKFPCVQVYFEGALGRADLISQTEWNSDYNCLSTHAYDSEHEESHDTDYDLRGKFAPSMALELLDSLGSQAEEEER
jgi:hypothetical protein